LAQPHSVDNFIYCGDRSSCEAAGRQSGRSFTILNPESENDPNGYLLILNSPVILNDINISAMRDEMESLAGKVEGRYDGWGTEVVLPRPN
jgi:regulator of RNase E activity RraB